jgi:peptidoglycan hydrolase FlgJ
MLAIQDFPAGNPRTARDAPTAASGELIAQADDPAYRAKVEDAAVRFEGMFIAQMLNEMRKATEQINANDDSPKDKAGAGMLDHANLLVADAIATQRAFGIADCIVAQLLPAGANRSTKPQSPDTLI